MKVLFACPFVPWPLDSGGRIRTYHLVRALSERAEVHLRLVREPDAAPDAEDALAAIAADVRFFERERPGPVMRWSRPKLERWFHSPGLRAALGEAIDERAHDVVHLDELLLARALPPGVRTPVVQHHHKLDTILYDLLTTHGGAERQFDLWKLRRLERDAARRTRFHVACSAEDRAILLQRYPDLDVAVVPSGFDPDHFRARPDAEPRDPDTLLFMGSMSYGPNVDGVLWFAREVLPELRRARPATKLVVVGNDPAPEVRALGAGGSGVEVVGRVPDVLPYLERAAALVVPLRIGGGTRLKIVEALATGCPVVSTTTGAEGLDLADGVHLRLADGALAFGASTLALLGDPTGAAALGARGRAEAERRFRWDALADGLLDHWARAAASR